MVCHKDSLFEFPSQSPSLLEDSMQESVESNDDVCPSDSAFFPDNTVETQVVDEYNHTDDEMPGLEDLTADNELQVVDEDNQTDDEMPGLGDTTVQPIEPHVADETTKVQVDDKTPGLKDPTINDKASDEVIQDGQPLDVDEEMLCTRELEDEKFHRHQSTYATMAFSYSKDCPFKRSVKKFCIVTPTHMKCGKYRSNMWKKLESELLDEGVDTLYVLGYKEVEYISNCFKYITVKRARIQSRRLDKFCRKCGKYCARKKAFAIFKYISA